MTGTLGDLISRRYTLTAYCHACDHAKEIDLAALAGRFGREATVMGAIGFGPARVAGRALRCSVAACGSLRTSIRISPPDLASGKL